MKKPILCVDFDGVIHSYTSGWMGAGVAADPPVPGAIAWLARATEYFDVQIYSSRSKHIEGRQVMRNYLMAHAARELGPQHPLAQGPTTDSDADPYPIKFAHEKPAAFLTIDDRGLCFDGDFAKIDPERLRDFRPWNMRGSGDEDAKTDAAEKTEQEPQKRL